jgi:hypothetical protein
MSAASSGDGHESKSAGRKRERVRQRFGMLPKRNRPSASETTVSVVRDVLVISGPCGAGKSSVGFECLELLQADEVDAAMIDGELAYFHPKPDDDPQGTRKPRDMEGSPRRRLVRRSLSAVPARRTPALGGRRPVDPYPSRRLGRIEEAARPLRGHSGTLAQASVSARQPTQRRSR